MTTRKYSSRSQQTTLVSAVTSTGNTITVVSGSALLGGATVATGETFVIVIDPDTALEEIVEIYSATGNPVSTNTLTVTRGVDGSTGQAHSAGAVVRHMAIGRDYRDANLHQESVRAGAGTAHGIPLSTIVLTSDTGTVSNGMIAANAITSAKIADGTIVDADVSATAAVAASKIAGVALTQADIGTVTPTILGTNSVTTVKILDANVTTAKIADSAITSAKIADGTIVAGDIADGAITSAKILDATIVNADLSLTAGIAYSKLSLGGTITSADLVDGTIVATDIADGTITSAKMAVDPYARANHTGTQLAATVSNFDTQVRTNRLDQLATPTASVSMNTQKITGLALAVSDGDAVSVDWINSQKGVVNGIASLDGTGKLPTSQLPALAISNVYVVASQAAMLALPSDVGEIAIRTDVSKSFILTTAPASTLANWAELLTPPDAVLSVDGQTGAVNLTGTYLNRTTGQLLGNLDANSFSVTGLGTPTNANDAATKTYVDTVAGSATAAAASAAAAATTYDNFDDRYLGAKAVAPTLDNDGNALIVGAIYWNSVLAAMFVWSGSAWTSISSTAEIYRYRYTAIGGETTKSGIDDNGLTLNYIIGKEQVYLNGILLVRSSDYVATNGTSIASLAALVAGDILEIITFTAFDLATTISNSLLTAKGDLLVATSASTPGIIAVGTNGYFLKADSTTATGLTWAAVPAPDLTQYTEIIMSIMGAY